MKFRTLVPAAILLLSVSQSLASFDAYIEFDGGVRDLKGESQSANYQDWNALRSFELGVGNTIDIGSGTRGGVVGRASFKEFTITKKINAASPKLFGLLTTGQHLDSAQLVAVQAGDYGAAPSAPFYDVDLRLVIVQDISWSGSDGDDIVEETLVLQYGAMRVSQTSAPRDSEPSSTVYAQWSQVLNEASLDVDGGSGGTNPVAPSISGTTTKTVSSGSSSSFTFTISDADTAISTITSSATSLNTALIPNSSISISGTGSTRTVYFTASNTVGTGTIRISVNDNDGSTTRTQDVTVTIVETNAAPVIISPIEFEVCELSPSYLRGIAISDADAFNDFSVTLAVSSGQLDVSTIIPNGLSAAHITGNGSNQVTLTAPIDTINATFSDPYGLSFTPTSSSTVSLNLEVNDNDSLNQLTATQAVSLLPILTRYEFWEREKFTLAERTNGESDAIADMDQDSNVNLLEFAFNLDPKTNDQYELPLAIVSDSGSDYFQLTLPVRNNAPNLQYQLQRYSAATREWIASEGLYQEVGIRAPINPEFESVTLRISNPVTENDSELVRIFLKYLED